MKKLLSVLLALMTLLTLALPALASEEGEAAVPAGEEALAPDAVTDELVYSGRCGENLTWSVEPDARVLTISGTGRMEDYDPGNGRYAPWYEAAKFMWVTRLVIADGVTSIGGNAFALLDLTDVTIPGSVTSIGEYAFNACEDLAEINLPDSVTSIGQGAFADCKSLTRVNLPRGVTRIERLTFGYCSSLKTVTLPAGVTSVGESAFAWCESLTGITLPDGVTSVGEAAFNGCGSLTEITIPDSVTSIGGWAFAYCKAMKSVTLPGGLQAVSSNTFFQCDALRDVYFGGSQTRWNEIVSMDGNDMLANATVHFGAAETAKEVEVALDPNGGYIVTDMGYANYVRFNVTVGEVYGRLDRVIRDGFSFEGWYTDPVGGSPVTPGTTCTNTSDHVLYAHWKADAPAGEPDVKLADDAKTARAEGFAGLYARVALVIDNGGVSGLFVTQATINDDGTIVIPSFMVPGLTVTAVNIALVPSIPDIQSSTPTVRAMDYRAIGKA